MKIISKTRRILKKPIFWIIFLIFLFIWFNNTPLFTDRSHKKTDFLAHCALGQTYNLHGVKWDTNTAEKIFPPEHNFIGNTIPSIKAAFDYGADIVEFDIRLTKDKRLALFHDYILEYRTNGEGEISQYTLAELKTLDLGYGYTADKGKTYPLRGKDLGLMASMEEVLELFPDKEFLIHIKDGGDEIANVLIDYLLTLEDSQTEKLSAYGNDIALQYIREKFPHMKILSKARLSNAFLQYILIGWTGFIPESIRNMEIHLPVEYAFLFWGWPEKFLDRMESVNSRVVVVQYINGWSAGFDNRNDLKKLPSNYNGVIWTNRIDRLDIFQNE